MANILKINSFSNSVNKTKFHPNTYILQPYCSRGCKIVSPYFFLLLIPLLGTISLKSNLFSFFPDKMIQTIILPLLTCEVTIAAEKHGDDIQRENPNKKAFWGLCGYELFGRVEVSYLRNQSLSGLLWNASRTAIFRYFQHRPDLKSGKRIHSGDSRLYFNQS